MSLRSSAGRRKRGESLFDVFHASIESRANERLRKTQKETYVRFSGLVARGSMVLSNVVIAASQSQSQRVAIEVLRCRVESKRSVFWNLATFTRGVEQSCEVSPAKLPLELTRHF